MENNDNNNTRSQNKGNNRDRDLQNTGYDEVRMYRSRTYSGWGSDDEDLNGNRFSHAGKFRSNGGNIYGPGGGHNHRSNETHGYFESRDCARPSVNPGNSGYHSPYSRNDRNWWARAMDKVSSWFGNEAAERRCRIDKMNGLHR